MRLHHSGLFTLLLLATAATSPAQTTAAQLQSDADSLYNTQLAQDLTTTPAGPVHDVYAGALADRGSRFNDALQLLTPLAADTTLTPAQRALVLGSLADAHFKLFHYAQASSFYDQLFACCTAALPPSLLKDDQDDNTTLKILASTPPQTIALTGQIDVPTHPDPLGSITADVTVNNITTPWILDTGANITTITESFAKQLGLTPLPGTAQTMGATGAENPLHIAVIPTLTIGTATLHNVVALILPDANLTLGPDKKHSYTIPAILGYPVFQSLGIIRFTRDRFLAGPTLPVSGPSSPIYFDKLCPLVEVSTPAGPRLFLFDSGANATSFFVPYYNDFTATFAHAKKGKSRAAGAGGTSESRVYILDPTTLTFANRTLTLHHVGVRTTPVGSTSDRYEGSIGRDILPTVQSLTLDFIHDRLYLGDPIP
ncbi:MAG: retropepsin-like aspartic protease [Acidobacteriota bacterium]